MEMILPGLVLLLVLLFLLRRQVRQAVEDWDDSGSDGNDEELADIIAREKQRMQEEEDAAGN